MSIRTAQGISFAVAVDHARELLSGSHIVTSKGTPFGNLSDALDDYWQRFRRSCYRGRIVGSFDREWFSVWDSRTMQGAVAPGCGAAWDEIRELAGDIQREVAAAEETARQGDVFPGNRRELRQRYKLDY